MKQITKKLYDVRKENQELGEHLKFQDLFNSMRDDQERDREFGTYPYELSGDVTFLGRNQVSLTLKYDVSYMQGYRQDLSFVVTLIASTKTMKIRDVAVWHMSNYGHKPTQVGLAKTPKTLKELHAGVADAMLTKTRKNAKNYVDGLTAWVSAGGSPD